MEKYVKAVESGIGDLAVRVRATFKEHPVLASFATLGIAMLSVWLVKKIRDFVDGGEYE